MVGEAATETWFGNIWKSSRKSLSWDCEKPLLGILSFEVSRLMSKVVNLWQCLSDRHVVRLREEIANSVGIHKLVSQDEDYLMDLAFAEIIENFRSVAKSVSILGKKCVDPTYHDLESVFGDSGEVDIKWYGWRYRLKKMEKRVRKMEKFVAATEQLYSELEVLAELEQSLRRMRAGADSGKVKLLEFQQKVMWQRQEVKNLQEMSHWVRTHDYVVRLLLRSLFTIFERIKYVYGINNQIENVDRIDDFEQVRSSDFLIQSNNTISALMQISEENNHSSFSATLGRSLSSLGFGGGKSKSRNRKSHDLSPSTILCGKEYNMKARRYTPVGFAGCITGGSESPVIDSYAHSCGSSFRSNGASQKDDDEIKDTGKIKIPAAIFSSIKSTKVAFFNSKRNLLNAPPSALGYAALALHYSNVIILIEKLASSPHLISLDARDDLYYLLPATIKSCLRAKLKTFSRNLASSVYDAAFASEWRLALARILEWLSPLAHNMIRWQSERNFERQRLIFGSNVLLVQTLYFANQVETEAAIVELLMGLNYLYRFDKEINERPFRASSCSRACDGYLFPRDKMCCKMIEHTL